MSEYEYFCEVAGHWDGSVKANNKKEAQEKAEQDIRIEGLIPVGEIEVRRIPKGE